jgi:ABC-type branched-subunit amino acid transport system substrate-binding protein
VDAGADTAVIAADSEESTQAVSALAAAGVPQAVTVATSNDVSGSDNSEFFRFVPDQTLYAQLLAQSVHDAGAASLTVVSDNEPDSKSLAKAVTRSFNDLGGEVIATHGDFLVAGTDSQKQVASTARKIADSQPGAVLLVSQYGSADLAQQLMSAQ